MVYHDESVHDDLLHVLVQGEISQLRLVVLNVPVTQRRLLTFRHLFVVGLVTVMGQ